MSEQEKTLETTAAGDKVETIGISKKGLNGAAISFVPKVENEGLNNFDLEIINSNADETIITKEQ